MPVARIITRVPEESTDLVARLRARGYTVEMVDPGDFRVTPADLEIELDRLKTEEALAAAARFGRKHEAEIFVAAGFPLSEAALRAARTERVERGNILSEGFKRLLSPFRRAGAQAHAERAAKRQQKLDIEMAREAENRRRAEAKAAENAERERLRREEDARREAERAEMAARKREEERLRREEERLRREEEARRRVEQEALLAQQREQERVRREEQTRRR